MHKVAVIVRTKNRELFLPRAIESIINQTYKDWIIVVVNDGGDAKKVEEVLELYLKEYKDNIMLIHNEVSQGMEAAANKGIKLSESEYIVIHDDDDTWDRTFLENTIGFLESNSIDGIKGVVTLCNRVVERIIDGEIHRIRIEPYCTHIVPSIFRMAAHNIFTTISFVYERNVLEEIGYYKEYLPVLGDWEFNLRFLEKFDVHVISKLLANYHQREDSSTADTRNSLKDYEKLAFYDNLIRNQLLRKDIEKGTIGLGLLVNIAQIFDYSCSRLDKVEGILRKIYSGLK